jgi:uncharacterized protein (DUF2236 family)
MGPRGPVDAGRWGRCSALARLRIRSRWPGSGGIPRTLEDPWKRLTGTARWLVVTTFGWAELAEREAARVRRIHATVRGTTEEGRGYSAGDPELLRWVHLAFTDAFLAAQQSVGRSPVARFGGRWPDTYVAEWARSARALGGRALAGTEAELAEALAAYRPVLEPVPEELRVFLAAPPGLGSAERVLHRGLTSAAALLISPTLAPYAGVPGRGRVVVRQPVTRALLGGLRTVLGARSSSEEAARWRVGLGPAPARARPAR